ncbi:centlein isoform X2 [Denticeps clupeoides]|uniref:centlein isoform X2 n=1 Tax=Denticeps clupeoides TaxID=299321 RepID=UPI0010A51308|nr:centlein isoform X2 [Denticeps clupeoides]
MQRRMLPSTVVKCRKLVWKRLKMAEKDDSGRVFLLEKEVRSLSEELVRCQADKEFVWSLWKRLQVANPDLTQAVSLVVERENLKAETKDRKVLEILQAKDYKIQDLEQKVTAQQQEINNLIQRSHSNDEELALMKKELAALRQQQGNRSRELKECKEHWKKKEEEGQQALQCLEEAKEELEGRCSTLQAELDRAREQDDQKRLKDASIQATVKDMEQELSAVKQEVFEAEARLSVLSTQLNTTDMELKQKDNCVAQLRQELQNVQVLYKQSVDHVDEQTQLIQQLEGLNLDTQRVLRSQEQAHTADTVSYHKLYTELTVAHRALVCSEAQLRQRDIALSAQLQEKDQQILHLQEQLRQLASSAVDPTQARQTNSEHFEELQKQRLEDNEGDQTPGPSLHLLEGQPLSEVASTKDPSLPQYQRHESRQRRGRQDAVEPSSLSLSPRSSSTRANAAERRIEELKELLVLKTQENEALRKAHDKRYERLRLIQTNYRTVKEQLKEAEDTDSEGRTRTVRAEPWELRQENSDGVWKELAFFRRQNQKLLAENADLEEQLDVMRVQAAMDRAATKELRLFLHQEHKEMLQKVAQEEDEVRSSSPKKHTAERLRQSFQKIEQLEQKMLSLEKETDRLRQDNQKLQAANDTLVKTHNSLQTSLRRLRRQGAAQEEAVHAQATAEWEKHLSELQALQAEVERCRRETDEARREASQAKQRQLQLRQEVGVLRAEQHFHRVTAQCGAKGPIVSARVRSRVPRPKASLLAQRLHLTAAKETRNQSPVRDGWEDVSADSASEEESSDSQPHIRPCYPKISHKLGCRYMAMPLVDLAAKELPAHTEYKSQEQRKKMRRRTRALTPTLRQRILSLQQQLMVVRQGRDEAERRAKDLEESGSRMSGQLHSLNQRLSSSQQLSQKLTTDLAQVELQKKHLELELEQWKRMQQQAIPLSAAPSSQSGSPILDPSSLVLKQVETEVKQLQAKLKCASNEVTKLTTTNKGLRAELADRDQRLKELQEKVSHSERDVAMKRQLVEDMKSRLKFFHEAEKNHRHMVEDLEKKVKTLSEEASNRKTFIESLKRRLSVATTEKSQHETSSLKFKEELEKKEQKLEAMQLRLGHSEKAMAELELTASRQMHGLAQQSSQALETVQQQLCLATSQLEQLHTFIHALASETERDVQDMKIQVRRRKRQKRKALNGRSCNGLSKRSIQRAQSIAASILNVTEMDLAEMLDSEEEEDRVSSEASGGRGWLQQVCGILQQQVPSAAQLMDTMLEKIKERKVLTEELATLGAAVSEKRLTAEREAERETEAERVPVISCFKEGRDLAFSGRSSFQP